MIDLRISTSHISEIFLVGGAADSIGTSQLFLDTSDRRFLLFTKLSGDTSPKIIEFIIQSSIKCGFLDSTLPLIHGYEIAEINENVTAGSARKIKTCASGKFFFFF